jgi:hypothetical protein
MLLSAASLPIVMALLDLKSALSFTVGHDESNSVLRCSLCVGVCAAADTEIKPMFACNLNAISPAERFRYNGLVKRLRAAIRDWNELTNGYAFKLDGKAITLAETVEWIGMERLCCPFLTLQLAESGDQAGWLLTLSGPEGVKQLITAEFPIP